MSAEGRGALKELAQLGIVRRRGRKDFFEAGVLLFVQNEEALVGETSLCLQSGGGENEITDATGVLFGRPTNERILFFGEAQVQASCLRGAHRLSPLICTEYIRTDRILACRDKAVATFRFHARVREKGLFAFKGVGGVGVGRSGPEWAGVQVAAWAACPSCRQ